MKNLSSRQYQILKTMGVDVWVHRGDQVSATLTEEAETQSAGGTVSRQPDAQPVITKPLVEEQLAETTTAVEPVSIEPEPEPKKTEVVALQTLEDIRQTVSECSQCGLCEKRNNTVPGEGHPHAEWMFIGEAPGQNEDLQGRPFVGRAGQLLDAMISALGMQREQVYIANVVKCRPPGNRDPEPNEVSKCEPYLLRQIELIQPKVIIVLGRVAAQALLKTADPLGKIRTQTYEYGAQQTPLVATYHPAYLLRSPEEKAKAWDDLCKARLLLSH